MAGRGNHREAQRARVQAVAVLLTELLAHTPAYRTRWQHHARRLSGQTVHQGAVAQVLAEHLWDSGEVPDTQTDLPRRLKDTVSRALSGRALPAQTLRLFIDAFGMGDLDAARLWASLSGGEPTRLTVFRPTTDSPDQDVRPGLAPVQPHRTVSVHDFHHIGADGRPLEHHTVQVVRALERSTHHTYRCDTNAVALEVLRGGRAGPLQPAGPGVYSVDITFDAPLAPGETASLEYRILFSYRYPPQPEFRRTARQRMENVGLNVHFDPDRVPARVWFGVWEDADGPPSVEEPVELGPALSVHRYLDSMENVAAGFHWSWRGGPGVTAGLRGAPDRRARRPGAAPRSSAAVPGGSAARSRHRRAPRSAAGSDRTA